MASCPRDLEYERTQRACDEQSMDSGIKCKNYKFCRSVLPDWWWECKAKYICVNCDIDWCRELEFTKEKKECTVCMETKTLIKFPSTCEHWFCCRCTNNIVFGIKALGVSPVPPCPNGCENPPLGRQCGCEEYDCIEGKWEADHFEDYQNYNRFIEENEFRVKPTHKCPLCRSEVVFKKW